MKKLIYVTTATMLLSLPVLANSSRVTPSSGVKTEESTTTKSSTSTLPSGDKMHQDTTIDSTKIEAQEEDTSSMDSNSHMNRKSGATTEPMQVDED